MWIRHTPSLLCGDRDWGSALAGRTRTPSGSESRHGWASELSKADQLSGLTLCDVSLPQGASRGRDGSMPLAGQVRASDDTFLEKPHASQLTCAGLDHVCSDGHDS